MEISNMDNVEREIDDLEKDIKKILRKIKQLKITIYKKDQRIRELKGLKPNHQSLEELTHSL